jgi:hypothetical protein
MDMTLRISEREKIIEYLRQLDPENDPAYVRIAATDKSGHHSTVPCFTHLPLPFPRWYALDQQGTFILQETNKLVDELHTTLKKVYRATSKLVYTKTRSTCISCSWGATISTHFSLSSPPHFPGHTTAVGQAALVAAAHAHARGILRLGVGTVMVGTQRLVSLSLLPHSLSSISKQLIQRRRPPRQCG